MLLIGLGLALSAALHYIRVLRRRCRTRGQEIERYQNRDLQRARYCDAFGHHLDEFCLCTRCLTEQHDYEMTGSEDLFLRSELVNPDADPGALYLDSNFQPDYDYGLTQSVYQTVKTCSCRRCSHRTMTRDEHAVEDARQ
jgi:hypothetical protein